MNTNRRILSGSLLVSGTAIGAGMLGIPLVTGLTGFFPGILITFAVWAFMLCTGLLFMEVTLWLPDGNNILTMSERFLGKQGRYLAGLFFIFLYYAFMVAYFAAGAPLLTQGIESIFQTELGIWQGTFIFGFIFALIVGTSPKSIDRANLILVSAMVLSYILLIGVGTEEVKWEHLTTSHFSKMYLALPVLFGAFGYHNIIPSLSTYLKRDRTVLKKAILYGTLISLVVYLIWQWLMLGALPQDIIEQTLKEGKPVTAAFGAIHGQKAIVTIGRFFAFFAITTSILGVGFSMVDFLGDGLKMERKGLHRIILTILTFSPAYLIASIKPDVFDIALGIAGGYGEAFLNGILPITLVFIGRYRENMPQIQPLFGGKILLIVLFIFSLIVMGIETLNLIF